MTKKKLVRKIISAILRRVISRLPDFLSVWLGLLGYTHIIKRSPSVNFDGKLYNSEFRVNVRADYAIERMATQTVCDLQDPYRGLAMFDLNQKTALDIGANVGTVSIGFVVLGCKKVHAVEPGPLYNRLQKNIKKCSLIDTVSSYNIGLDEKDGELFWAEDKNNSGNAHLVSAVKFNVSEFLRVPVTTLDNFVKENVGDKIDVIKIDVEGMEWKVLSGGKDMITSCLPIVVAETHRVASDMMKYDCITPMFNFFYELGYRSFSLDDTGRLVEFIYPNFGFDTFFVHPNDMSLLKK
jgi:FkbM family methyltransferase